MAIHDNTLDELVERTCKLVLHDWLEGSATSAGTSLTLKDTKRVEANDFFNEHEYAEIYLRSGDGKGEVREITDFVSATTITWGTALTGAVTTATGDTYSIHLEYKRDEVVEAINTAIDMVAKDAFVWKVDESSIELAASVYEYNLPTGLIYLCKLVMADGDGLFYDTKIDPTQYGVVHTIPPKVRFHKFPADQKHSGHWYGELFAVADLTAGRKLRVEGLGRQARLETDTDSCGLDPAYIMYQAGALLHMSRIRSSEHDPDDHRIQWQLCQQQASAERERIVKLRLPPDTKPVEL